MEDLIRSFEEYPGVGPRTAERMAVYTLERIGKDKTKLFINNLEKIFNCVRKCEKCGFYTENDLCDICKTKRKNELLIVENSKQIIQIESLKIYDGYYFILDKFLSPIDGINPENIGSDKLFRMINDNKIEKITFAISSTINKELTVEFLKEEFKNQGLNIEVYRIGYGIPFGSDIEYVDNLTLKKALERKSKI